MCDKKKDQSRNGDVGSAVWPGGRANSGEKASRPCLCMLLVLLGLKRTCG